MNKLNTQNTQNYWLPAILIAVSTMLSLAIKISMFDYVFGDYTVFLSKWVATIKANGYLSALSEPFYNYTPLYMYVLTLIAKLDVNPLYGIKVVSILFEYAAAFYVGRLAFMIWKNKIALWLPFVIVPLIPGVILNSAFMSQCDSIYVTFMLGSVYYLFRKKQIAAMLFLGIAFSLKSQTSFILPFYFVYMLRGHIKWYYFLLLPVVYFIALIPAWMVGRPLVDLLLVYVSQTNDSYVLSSYLPNIYLWIYQFLDSNKIPGMVFVAVLVLVSGFILRSKKFTFTLDAWIVLLFLSAIVCPFFLPSMHERYVYFGDLCAILYVVVGRKNIVNWLVAGGVIFISFFSYAQCLHDQSYYIWSDYPKGVFSFIKIVPWKAMSILYFGIIVYVVFDLVRILQKGKDKDEFVGIG